VKKGIHPKYYPEAKVVCGCGNTWVTGSTQPEIRTDVCSACHPFFTGQTQRLVDRAGQVERFNRRVEQAQDLAKEAAQRRQSKERRRRERQLVDVVDETDVEPIDLNAEASAED
jgi:large subunit ribosomal protein L31